MWISQKWQNVKCRACSVKAQKLVVAAIVFGTPNPYALQHHNVLIVLRLDNSEEEYAMQQQHLVNVPKELFKIFSEKYGMGESEECVIDDVTYRIQQLTIETTRERKLPLVDSKSRITIGLFKNGKVGSMNETARLMVWNHMPQVSGVQSMSIWVGIHGMGPTRRERVVTHLGNGLDPFDPIVPETNFIAEVMQVTYKLGENIKPREYVFQEEKNKYVPAEEFRYI